MIPNLSNTNVEAALNAFIEKYEVRFLKTLFGAMYTDYAAGILVVPIDTIWTALQTADLKDALANYVYYWWMRKDRTKTTSEGETRPAVENGDIVFSNEKMIDCWNQIWPTVNTFAEMIDPATYTTWPQNYKFFLYEAFRPVNDFGI
jgi:hypothetical protein